jgi:hypothetical protein
VLDVVSREPSGDRLVAALLAVLCGLTPAERLAWAAAADEIPSRTSVAAYWVSLVALFLATASLASGALRVVLLIATACGIFLARHQGRHASRLRMTGNLLRSLVAADGSLPAAWGPPAGIQPTGNGSAVGAEPRRL